MRKHGKNYTNDEERASILKNKSLSNLHLLKNENGRIDDDTFYDIRLSLIFIGDSGVGKSCLLLRFAEDIFNSGSVSTIGVDFKSRILTVDEIKIKLEIWDTAGQEKYQTLTQSYYRNAKGAIIVYDVLKRSSFVNIHKWIHEIKKNGPENIPMILVANKYDLINDVKTDDLKKEIVSIEEGKRVAMDHKMLFIQASALSSENVIEIFHLLTKEIIKRNRENDSNKNISLTMNKSNQSKFFHKRNLHQPSPKSSCC